MPEVNTKIGSTTVVGQVDGSDKHVLLNWEIRFVCLTQIYKINIPTQNRKNTHKQRHFSVTFRHGQTLNRLPCPILSCCFDLCVGNAIITIGKVSGSRL